MTLFERERRQRAEALKEGIAIGREEGRAEGREEGRAEGREEGLSGALENLMSTMQISLDEAMRLLKIPLADKEQYLPYLS